MTVTRNKVEALAESQEMAEYDPDTDPREAGEHDVPRKPVQALGEAPWLLQVSLKTPAGALINVRGMTSWDIDLGLDAIAGLAHKIAETESLFGAHAALAPLRPQAVPQQGQPQSFAPQQQQPSFAPQQGQQQAPMCDHGMPAKFVQGGISKSTGRPYRAFWACAMPREQQCRFRADG